MKDEIIDEPVTPVVIPSISQPPSCEGGIGGVGFTVPGCGFLNEAFPTQPDKADK